MRILLSGGVKTQNILRGIEKKFKASGDEFIVEEFIDGINNIFTLGDYFDKAVITEQSITNEYEITDESMIRNRINQFAIESSNRAKKSSYVFLTQDENMANMIHEEILPIMNDSVVVLEKPPYTVSFFVSIIVSDVKQLPSDIVFEPQALVTNDNFDNTDEYADLDTSESYTATEAPSDFDQELFGTGDTFAPINQQFDMEEKPQEFEQQPELNNEFLQDEFGANNTQEYEGIPAEMDTPEQFRTDNNELNDDNSWGDFNGPDETIAIDSDEPIKQSGELPVESEVEPENQGFIQGFDNEDYGDNDLGNEMYGNDTVEEPQQEEPDFDLYTPEQKGISLEKQQEQSNPLLDADYNQGFETPEYNSMAMGFAPDVYGDDSDEDSQYQNEVNNEIYGNNQDNLINPDDYKQVQDNNEQQLEPQINQDRNMTPQPGVELSKPKRGFFARKNKAAVQPVQNIQPVPDVNSAGPALGGGRIDPNRVKEELKPFAARGNSIVVTGCGGCGTSTIAFNLANIISQLGYTVLLVDMDTEGRTQSYISKANYESMEPDSSSLLSAVNSSNGINTHINVVKSGFHLLTMGLGTDTAPVTELLHKEKISRFINLARTSHNFVIYDVPFEDATGFLSDVTYMCDNLALVTAASNWGITKTMLAVCNIASDDMRDTVFNRAQIVFNRYRNLNRVLGNKVKTCVDITKVMDRKVLELAGEDPGFYFEDLHIAGIINDDPVFEDGWFEDVQYSDTKKGQEIFLELLEHIVLKK